VTPTLREVLFVACGGALGSVSRFLVASAMTRWVPTFPLGTLLVNVVGCFLMGMLAGWTSDRTLRAALGVGVLGGFTTFSALGGDTLALAQGGSMKLAAVNVVANVGLGLVAVWAGRAMVVG